MRVEACAAICRAHGMSTRSSSANNVFFVFRLLLHAGNRATRDVGADRSRLGGRIASALSEFMLALGGVSRGVVVALGVLSLVRWKTAAEAAVALHGGYFCSFACGSLLISSAVMLT